MYNINTTKLPLLSLIVGQGQLFLHLLLKNNVGIWQRYYETELLSIQAAIMYILLLSMNSYEKLNDVWYKCRKSVKFVKLFLKELYLKHLQNTLQPLKKYPIQYRCT